MELMKKKLKTDKVKAKSILQIPMEEDINISDSRPDVKNPIFHRGRIKLDEIKTGMNKAWIKGKLIYQVLYLTEGAQNKLACMEGEFAFMEEVYMEGVDAQDRVICETKLEDMRVNMINSRKLSIQAVIMIQPRVEEISEEEICVEIVTSEASNQEAEKLEYRKKDLNFLESVISKRDLFRIHEETKLPPGMDSVGELIWKSAEVRNVQFRPLDEKIGVSGDIQVFIMYQGNCDEQENWYETKMAFSGYVDCQGCRENMLADITYDIVHEEISIREDGDAEARIITAELALELELKLWNADRVQVVSDVYGVSCEVDSVTSPKLFKTLFQESSVEEKKVSLIELQETDATLLQICHYEPRAELEQIQLLDNAIILSGVLLHRILYRKNEENMGLGYWEKSVPFEIEKALPGVTSDMDHTVHLELGQAQATIKESNKIECSTTMNVNVAIYAQEQQDILSNLDIHSLDSDKIEALPGITIYFVKAGDSLWRIGREYYVSVEEIKEINQLTSDEIHAGDKLLIVKSR